MADSLAPDAVKPLLRGRFGRAYRYAEVTPSTQRMLAADEAEGAVAVAEEQTAGRGRLGRSWQAPAGTSVLVSVLLLPDVEPAKTDSLRSAYLRLYDRLWAQDEKMMVERQKRLDAGFRDTNA